VRRAITTFAAFVVASVLRQPVLHDSSVEGSSSSRHHASWRSSMSSTTGTSFVLGASRSRSIMRVGCAAEPGPTPSELLASM
jgi:hypothetical protein